MCAIHSALEIHTETSWIRICQRWRSSLQGSRCFSYSLLPNVYGFQKKLIFKGNAGRIDFWTTLGYLGPFGQIWAPLGHSWATLAKKPVDPHNPKKSKSSFVLGYPFSPSYLLVMWEQVGSSGFRGKPRKLLVKPKEGDVLVGRWTCFWAYSCWWENVFLF